ncbi:MAG: O-antigen ligase family protein [Ilumatobacteraceae bacterium]
MRERVVWVATVLALIGATRAPVYRVRLEMGDVPGDPIDDTRIQLIWCGLYLLLAVAAWPAWRAVWVRARSLVWSSLLFGAVLASSAVWSIQRERTIEQAGLLAMGMFAIALAAGSMTARRFAWAVWTATTLCVVGSVWAHVRDWHYTVDPKGNFVGWYFNRNALGPVAALVVLSSVMLVWRGVRGWRAVGVSAAGVMSAVVWWRTGSLTPLVAVLGALVVVAFAWGWARGDVTTRGRLRWAGAVFPLGLVMLIALRGTINSWFGRSATFSGRTELWAELFESWWHRPWGGYGFMAVWFDDDLRERLLERGRDLYEAHSGYLEVLIGAGVLGAFALGWLLWVLIGGVVRSVPAGSWASQWWVAMIAFVLLMNTGETFIGANIAAWLVMVGVGVQARVTAPEPADR